MARKLPVVLVVLVLLSLLCGCGGGLTAPFDQMKTTPITVYRLQNYEPPPQVGTGPQIPGLPPIQIPPELQRLTTLLPPNLVPPGLIPGTTTQPQVGAPRFHNFRIIGWMLVNDERQREEILDVFGKSKSFENPAAPFAYAEFGFSFGNTQPAPGQGPPMDVLVSLSNNQVVPFNMNWPYGAKTGLAQETSRRIVQIVQRAFGG